MKKNAHTGKRTPFVKTLLVRSAHSLTNIGQYSAAVFFYLSLSRLFAFANLPSFLSSLFTPSRRVLGQFVFATEPQHPGDNLGLPWLLKSDVTHHLPRCAAWPLRAPLSEWATRVSVLLCGLLVARDVSTRASCVLPHRRCVTQCTLERVCAPVSA